MLGRLFPELRKVRRIKGVREVVVFGSAVRGKERPNDVDVALIVERPVEVRLPPLFHVVQLREGELFKKTLFKTLLLEGRTLDGKAFSMKFGMRPEVVYWYDLKRLPPAGKVRFSQALFGRKKGEGVLAGCKGRVLGRGAVAVPVERDEEMKRFFMGWKVNFSRARGVTE